MFREIGELLYPWPLNCINCGAQDISEDVLCVKCRDKLAMQTPVYGFAHRGFELSAAAHMYAGPAGTLVRALKYNTLKVLAEDMARDMIRAAVNAGIPKPDIVVYVPMHWRRRQDRFINQAQVLANAIAREWGICTDKALKRLRSGKQQARIKDLQLRRDNVRDAFSSRHDLSGMSVLLVDDVYTTGATARECSQALRAAGAKDVYLLVYSLAGDGRSAGVHADAPVDIDMPF